MAGNAIAPNSRVVRSREILESEVDGEVIALDIAEGECYGFNAVGSSVWRLLQKDTSVCEICDTLITEFNVERDVCEAEVTRLLGDLVSAGLVEIRSA